MSKKIKRKKFGDWQPRKLLGEGGNGVVWRALNSSSEIAAIKLLTKMEGNRGEKIYSRFKNEVKIVSENSDIEGLLPIIDIHLPTKIGKDIPWYVMPVAQPLNKYLVGRDFEVIIQSVLEIGKVLTNLHERGISHRDIKPANILVKDNKYHLSDFGLVDYPDKQDLTGTGERIGAKWTIAPEMERDSQNADGKPADVYSLAKTLWILLTGNKYGFEGQYHPESVNSLINLQLTEPEGKGFFFSKAPLLYIKPLEDLLRDSTDDDPSQRPTTIQFVERLESWIQIYKDFRKRNPLQWQDIQKNLFPTALPQRVIWENIEDIVKILNILCSFHSLNHMLLPDQGGMDLLGASLGHETETLELIVDERVVYIVRPKRLIFESFDFEMDWNYFRLETGNLEPTYLTNLYCEKEWLAEIEPSYYISRDDWEDDRNQDREYPAESRLIARYIRGDFLILQKTSYYNRIGCTYDGKFNQMSSDEFRQYITEKIQFVREIQNNEQLIKDASNKGLSLDDLIYALLENVFRHEYLNKGKTKPEI